MKCLVQPTYFIFSDRLRNVFQSVAHLMIDENFSMHEKHCCHVYACNPFPFADLYLNLYLICICCNIGQIITIGRAKRRLQSYTLGCTNNYAVELSLQ